MAVSRATRRTKPVSAGTEHVVFIHGLFGSNLVLRDDPTDVCWGDRSIDLVRTILRRRDLLAQISEPRPLVPNGLTRNYRTFVDRLRLLGFHNLDRPRLSLYVYDWRLGIAEASADLDNHLAGVPGK